jgi:hypothetical protein
MVALACVVEADGAPDVVPPHRNDHGLKVATKAEMTAPP